MMTSLTQSYKSTLDTWFRNPSIIQAVEDSKEQDSILATLTNEAVLGRDKYLWWSSIYLHVHWGKELSSAWPDMEKAYKYGAPPVYLWYNRKKELPHKMDILDIAWEDWALCGSPQFESALVTEYHLNQVRSSDAQENFPLWLIFKQVRDTETSLFLNELRVSEIQHPTKLDLLATPQELMWLVKTLAHPHYSSTQRPSSLTFKVLDQLLHNGQKQDGNLSNPLSPLALWFNALYREYPDKVALIKAAIALRAPLTAIFEHADTIAYDVSPALDDVYL